MAWTKKRLGDVCNIINGKNQKDVLDINGKYPIFGSAGNVMGYATKYLCDQGTVIIGRKGNISTPIFYR
jgi:type I restriction enzyme S subunit